MAALPQVTSTTFSQEVMKADTPVLVDFYADWCAPCRMVAPIVEDLAREYSGRIKTVKLDVDSNGDVAQRYGVMSIPTLAIFKDGQMVQRLVGAQPKQVLKKAIDNTL